MEKGGKNEENWKLNLTKFGNIILEFDKYILRYFIGQTLLYAMVITYDRIILIIFFHVL